jgi:nucleotide-binding universal stress UspA family protein
MRDPSDKMAARILLATDDSEEARYATQKAVELAGKLGSELHVIYVGDSALHLGDMGGVALDPQVEEQAQQKLDEESQRLLDEQVRKIEEAGGSVAQAHLRMGGRADSIVRLAEEIDAGMVVMGSRGRGGIRRALMGSVADDVTRHAHCPVLVVRGDGPAALFPARIVLAIDGSEEAQAATDTVETIAAGTGSEVHVVHAGFTAHLPYAQPYMAENIESFAKQAEKEAREFLEGRVEKIKANTGLPVHAHLRRGNPSGEIVELAEEVDANLVVIGSRGLGGIRRSLMGGVSDSVVRHAHCPVLVVRHTEDEDGD